MGDTYNENVDAEQVGDHSPFVVLGAIHAYSDHHHYHDDGNLADNSNNPEAIKEGQSNWVFDLLESVEPMVFAFFSSSELVFVCVDALVVRDLNAVVRGYQSGVSHTVLLWQDIIQL